MLRTLTDDELLALYGDPGPYIRPDGSIGSGWEREILVSIDLPGPLLLSFVPPGFARAPQVHAIRCHRKIAASLKAAIDDLFAVPEAWATIGDFGGCYAWRTRRGSSKKLSKHAFGIAVDLDVADNPDHSKGNVHPATIECFARHDFIWGGLWAGNDSDPMHFEKGVRS